VTALLRRIAAAVEHRPGLALVALTVLTVVLGALAGQQQTDSDMTAFAPESDLHAANERINDEFSGTGASVQVIVDAGVGGDVLTPAGLAAAQRIEQLAESTPAVDAVLAPASSQAPAIIGFATPLVAAMQQQDIDAAIIGDDELNQLAAAVLTDEEAGPQASALLSRDLQADDGSAQAGLVIVRFRPGVESDAQADAELALRDAVNAVDFPGVRVSPFGEHIFSDQLTSAMNEEMPMLLGLAFLLIIAILLFTYRRIADVLIGLTGLVVTIVWTYGIAVLLGPQYLGITGVMSQISIIIPVLLIGLGIDYAIHLTSRYREEMAKGQTPPVAAHGAVSSVGGALVLATITTVVSFMTNLVSPLPPIRDFGLFVAGGVLAAFIVMLLLVPSARSLLDRRRLATGRFKPAPSGEATATGRVMSRAAVLAEHHAKATLAVAAVVTILAAAAGSQVSTTFSQDDFIPEGSEISTLLDDMQTLFGGDLDETTRVLIEGDVASPAAANAMLDATASMGDTEGIRTVGNQPQVSSPASVVMSLTQRPRLARQLGRLGLADDGFAPDADVLAMYALANEVAPDMMAGVLSDDGSAALLAAATTVGQEGAEELREAVSRDVAPLEQAGLTTTVVSEPLLLDESLDALTSSQTSGMILTLLIGLLVLVGFFTLRQRRPLLGVITMAPSALVVAWVAGSMWALGMSFNVMTAMVASLAIGIGVPFGIHISNRFTEELERTSSVDEAVRHTVTHTGGALLGSAATTAAGFGVLAFAALVPMQQFGIITALTITYSLIASVLIEPACLKLWADRRTRRDADDVVVHLGDDREHAAVG
jgi:uncharacterized protein